MGRQARRLALILVAVVAAGFAAAGLADSPEPHFFVYSYDQTPGDETDLSLDIQLSSGAPAAEIAAITIPVGYAAALTQPLGSRIGDADVLLAPAAGGAETEYTGTAVVGDPAAFAADPAAQACAPGTHGAIWNLALTTPSALTIPIAVDQLPGEGSYRLTMCLDSVRAASLKPTELYVVLESVLTNPSAAGLYWWSARITPLGATGVADPATAYDLQGGEPLPETLTLKSVWNPKKHLLTLSGKLVASGKPRPATRIHLFAGATSDPDKMREIGAVTTGAAGAYTFTKKYAKKPPAWVYSIVYFYLGNQCQAPSTAPAGCKGWTLDGTNAVPVKVKIPKTR